MRILVDMNLTPEWCEYLRRAGHDAVHWSTIGPHAAPDSALMRFAADDRRVVFTHDLDFGVAIAMTGASGPSIVQVRTTDPVPTTIGEIVVGALRQFEGELEKGAIVTIDPTKVRARVLPLER